MSKSAFLTPALAIHAIELTTPAIKNFIALDPKRNVVHVIILDPVLAAAGEFHPVWAGAIGEQDRSKWANTYAKFAEEKAMVSLQTKLPSHLVQHEFAHMYRRGHFKYGGSEYRKGIIVAASGLDWHLDYAISALVAATLDGLIKGSFGAEFKRKPHFVGTPEEE